MMGIKQISLSDDEDFLYNNLYDNEIHLLERNDNQNVD